jgi:hypothetical protein
MEETRAGVILVSMRSCHSLTLLSERLHIPST